MGKNRPRPLEMREVGDHVRKKILFSCFLIILIHVLSACWSYSELTDIAFVTALGVDKKEDGKYSITVQLINPRNVFGSKQGGVQGIPVTVYQGEGETIYEAARETSQHISRRLYFSHADLVVIGEELAKEGIIEIFDVAERAAQFRSTAQIVIAKGATAGELLQILAPLDQISAYTIIKTIENSQNAWGHSIETKAQEVLDSFYCQLCQPVISGMVIEGDKEKGMSEDALKMTKTAAPLSAEGIGIFKDGKLVAWAEKEKARGIVWLRNRLRETIVNIDWEGKKDVIAFRVIRSKTKIKPKLKDDSPEIHVHIDVEGNIGETHVPIDIADVNLLRKLDKTIAETIKKEIESTIELCKKEKADVFQFSKKISVHYPEYWKKNKDIWEDEVFPELPVHVTVDAFIRRSELRLKPYFYEINK